MQGSHAAARAGMMRLRGFSQALEAVYDASLAPENWPGALSRVGSLFDGEGAAIVFYDSNGPADFIACPELAPAVRVYQAGEWWRRDLHAQRALALRLRAGDVFNDAVVATPEEIETHPIYVDFFREVGFGWLMSSVLLPEGDTLICLSVPRAKARGAFGADEMEMLRYVGRHVERALRGSLRVASLEKRDGMLVAALDAVDVSLFGLDEGGRVVFANRAAEADRENYFAAGSDRLAPHDPAERRELEARLAEARGAAGEEAPTPSVVTGLDGRRMAVWALPAPEASGTRVGAAAQVILLAASLDGDQAIDPTALRCVFGLSPSEARLAALLGSGVALRAAAARLGVTEGTARIVLKRVFRKLGINRQTQLVLQLSRLREWGPIRSPRQRIRP